MTPEILQTLTSAKSVGVPTGATQADLAIMLRNQRAMTADGTASRVMRQAQWTSAECAQACHDLDKRYFYAIRYVYAGDETCYGHLRVWLKDWALEHRERVGWPKKVITYYGARSFIQPLVDAVLTEYVNGGRIPITLDFCLTPEAGRHYSEPKTVVRAFVGITEATWQRTVSPIYETIYNEFRTWEEIGTGWMKRWLRESDEVA